MSGAAVTPSGVREGDPAALAALCTVRGPSVLAYCRQVAGESEAGPAAADAFARFRKAVVEAGDTTSVNPEALLIGATRMAAAQRAHVVAPGHCAAVPRLLAERADKTLPEADLARLEAHLAECWACRAPVSRFKAAERAYLDPPEPKLDPAVAEQILAALVAAVPPPPEPEPEPPVLLTPNGAVPHVSPAPDPDATQAFAAVGEPRPAAPEMEGYDPADVAADEIGSEPAPRPKRARRAAPALLGGLARRGKRRERGAKPAPEPEAQAAAAAAATAFAAPPVSEAAAPVSEAAAPVSEAAAPEAPAQEAVAAPAAATPDPIPYEAAEYAPRPRDRRGARSRRLPVLLPIILIIIALLVALFVSGVFGGSEPESSPRVAVPAAAPAAASKADPDVVPGAKEATGDQVERAKARRRGETPPSDERETAAKKKATAGASTPPPAATPAANAAPPPPPPPPPPARQPSAQKQIDAGSGATGAEQIPPPADTSDVPDLAPPTDAATSP